MNLRLAGYVAFVSTFCLLCSTHARAQQGFALDRFTLAPSPEDGLTLQLPSTLGPKRLAARLSLGYQNEPLVSGAPSGGDVVVVQHHLATQLSVALGLGERFEVFMGVPITLYQSGEEPRGSGLTFNEPSSTGVGDLALGGSVHLLGERDHGFALGLNAALLLPIGSTDALASDGEFGARGTLTAAAVLDAVTLAIEGGVAYRPKRRLGFIDSGSELLMRAGAYVPVSKSFRVLGELNAATRLGNGLMFKSIATPLEGLIGADYTLSSGLRFGVAGGPGLTIATGTPAFRVLGTIGYAGPRESAAPDAEDRDHDGFDDDKDRCADDPEDLNGFEDTDGCPDAARDSDGDHIADATDRCPAQAEDSNGFEDTDGCPDSTRDSDNDGVADATDKCATQAEDKDGVEDADGCPDADVVLDTDLDGLVDDTDRCPKEPETKNGFEDDDGCPDVLPRPPAEISLPDPMGFDFKSALIKPKSTAKLTALLGTLKKNPELHVIAEGHSSGDGNAEFNQKLSEQRAQNVKAWLVKRGIAQERIDARGLGSSQPIGSGEDEASRTASRRVEIRKAP